MTAGSNLRRLDRGRRHDGPMTYQLDGAVFEMPDPADMEFEVVLTILHTGLIASDYTGLTLGQAEALSQRWMAHHDLPTFSDAQRLAYVVDRYADDLTFDLRVHARMDLAEMWRSRRWRTLLRTIDRLPGHSLYAEAVSMDEEHATMLAESMAARESTGESAPGGPALRTWTPEVKVLTDLLDATRRVEWAVIASVAGKGAPAAPEPSSRPMSILADAMRKAEHKRRQMKHRSLTERLLPHKRSDHTPPPEPQLPPGWKYNAAGRLVDERGKYAKKPQ